MLLFAPCHLDYNRGIIHLPRDRTPQPRRMSVRRESIDSAEQDEQENERNELVKILPYRNSGRDFDNRWPGESVRCDLVIPRWRELVTELSIGDGAEEVIASCEIGFDQGIPRYTLKWFTPPNHESDLVSQSKIDNTLAKEQRAFPIFGSFTHKEVYEKLGFSRSSPMGSVTNGDGSFQIINELSYPCNELETPLVNSFVDKEDYGTTWDDFKVVLVLFQEKGKWKMAIFDWEKAYWQIPLHINQW